MTVIAAAIIYTLLSVVSFGSDGSTRVRDRYGNLAETEERHGDDSTVQDGNIIGTGHIH
jgi:hypothetical protein